MEVSTLTRRRDKLVSDTFNSICSQLEMSKSKQTEKKIEKKKSSLTKAANRLT